MANGGWDATIRSICAELCEGDPPCYELAFEEGEEISPCATCRRLAGEEVPEPLDPAAVVRLLL